MGRDRKLQSRLVPIEAAQCHLQDILIKNSTSHHIPNREALNDGRAA